MNSTESSKKSSDTPLFSEQYVKDFKYLPIQSLQHHSKPLSREAQEEIIQGLKEKIALVKSTTKPNTIDRDLALYHLLASGGISGINLIALPSADNKVDSTLFNTQETNTVIGRAPYDQANLWPVSQEGVAAVPNDKTAEFLDKKGTIIQYSFVGQNQPERASETSSAPLWFSKGLLVVIPDEDWPDQYSKSDIAFSGDDVKTHSSWREKKVEEFSKNPELITLGSLVTVEVYDPGSSIAMPINAQRYLSGDFDGDHVFVMDKGYPKVSKMIKEDYEHRQEDASSAEKPSKTYTSAFD